MIKDKLQAFGYHFLISALLMTIAAGVIFYIWYPKPFFGLFGVINVFILMLGVDLIVGPLLTFIVYKKGKRTLKMDLAIIGLFQLLSFGWGMGNIANARPAWITFYKDTAYAISPAFLNNPKNNLNIEPLSIFKQNWLKPKLVMISSDDTTPNIIYHIDKYSPYDSKIAVVNKIPLSKIEKADKTLFETIQTKFPTAKGYFPIITEASLDLPLILIDENGEPIGTVVAENTKVNTH